MKAIEQYFSVEPTLCFSVVFCKTEFETSIFDLLLFFVLAAQVQEKINSKQKTCF